MYLFDQGADGLRILQVECVASYACDFGSAFENRAMYVCVWRGLPKLGDQMAANKPPDARNQYPHELSLRCAA
jgi:hypothetical protein